MQPNLDDLNKKIEENRDFISRIAFGIPAFKGYVQQNEKYDADKMIREIIVDKMMKFKKELGIVSSELVKKTELEAVQEIDSLLNVTEGLLKKVEFADYGLTGSFSKIKFTEENQNSLLEFDWRLITKFEEIAKLVESFGDDPIEKVKEIKTEIRSFEKIFDDRKYVILEVI